MRWYSRSRRAENRTIAAQPQVFSDPSQRRRHRVRRSVALFAALIVLWVSAFLVNITEGNGGFPLIGQRAEGESHAAAANLPLLNEDLDPQEASLTPAPACAPGPRREGEVLAVLPATPNWSFLSLQRACDRISVLVPEWYFIDGEQRLIRESLDPEAEASIATYRETRGEALALWPAVRLGAGGDPALLQPRLTEPGFRAQLVSDLTRVVAADRAEGLCLDFGGWPEGQHPGATALARELDAALARTGGQSCLILGADQGLWRDAALTGAVDRVILRLYRSPWLGSAPGPFADMAEMGRIARDAAARIGTDRLVPVLGSFAMDWVSGRPMPERVGYARMMTRAAEHGAAIRFDTASGNSFATYLDDEGNRHRVWLADMAAFHNLLRAVEKAGLRDVGIDNLGYEDPGVWNVLAAVPPVVLANTTRRVDLDPVVYSGFGPFLRYRAAAVPGRRAIEFAPDGTIAGQRYVALPSAARIERFGRAAPDQIVLSFDDGPDPAYTPAILDALAAADVPATFFVVGNLALRDKPLVRRILDEGHELGSHTFLHPRMDRISAYRSAVEINSVQKLVAGTTGHSMRLYREPFLRGEGPLSARRAEPLRRLQAAGYIIAGSDIVPLDWEDTTAEEIVAHVIESVESGRGNVIVLHDSGADRSETVRAMPMLITELRARGYSFASMAQVLGLDRAAIMPPTGAAPAVFETVSFNAVAALWEATVFIFWAAIAIGAGRAAMMLVLALIRRPSRTEYAGNAPSVSVIIPAYNEETVINASVARALASRYPDLRVIVVDDGSTDRTLEVVSLRYGRHPRVQILSQPNQGKWAALNRGYRAAETEVAVCIDADTQIDPTAIAWLCRHFNDPRVGAVAGRLIVGNRNGLLTGLQALEYTTAQNIDRRAQELVNGMLVVPGAIGAWRVEAVRKAGLLSGATLSEDADLTVSVIRAGYRALYEERALARTEVPASIGALMRQRLRWTLGMLQVGWKHRGAMREGRAVGLISLPDLAFFGYLFPLLAPLADLFFFYLLWDLAQGWLATAPRVGSGVPAYLFFGYLALPLMDVLSAAVAIKLDKRAPWRLLLLFPFQRLFYRQLLYFSVFRALIRAVTGSLAKWQKAERFGLVPLRTQEAGK